MISYEAGTTALIMIGVGLALAAKFLFKQDEEQVIKDNTPPTLSMRGSWVPVVIGRRKIAPVIGWVGLRTSKKSGGDGGKGGDPGEPEKTTYFEEAWHILCVGPVHRIIRIWQDGKTLISEADAVDTDTYNRTTSRTVSVPGEASFFDVYWGGVNSEEGDPWGTVGQGVNSELGSEDRVGVASSWPRTCYVHWKPKVLGSAVTWGSILYEIEVFIDAGLISSPMFYNTDGAGVTYENYPIVGVDKSRRRFQIDDDHRIEFPVGRQFEVVGGVHAGFYTVRKIKLSVDETKTNIFTEENFVSNAVEGDIQVVFNGELWG